MNIHRLLKMLKEASNKGSSQKVIKVFGENHTHFDEVQSIRNKIDGFKPDLIIHELEWEEPGLKSKYTVVPLEPSNRVGVSFPNDLVKQCAIREREMVSIIKKWVEKNEHQKIAIVVGDTHLRTDTRDLGPSALTTYLNSIGARIIRSKYKEIN